MNSIAKTYLDGVGNGLMIAGVLIGGVLLIPAVAVAVTGPLMLTLHALGNPVYGLEKPTIFLAGLVGQVLWLVLVVIPTCHVFNEWGEDDE